MSSKNPNDDKNKEKNDEEKNLNVSEKLKSDRTEKPILPRKRKIVRNVQLPIVFIVFLTAFITAVVWKFFFNQSILGAWHYINEGEYTETFDAPSETEDTPDPVTNKYTQRVCYEFKENGDCIVTLGTMSVVGQYDVYSTENSNMITANVSYQYTPLLYGSYSYKVEGNLFTGRKLIITDLNSDTRLELEPGKGENPLVPYDDAELDDRLVGTWRDDEYGAEYEFTSDGYLTRTNDDGLIVEHVYTILNDEGSYILTKYFGDSEQSYSYSYSFEDDNLILNGNTLKKID